MPVAMSSQEDALRKTLPSVETLFLFTKMSLEVSRGYPWAQAEFQRAVPLGSEAWIVLRGVFCIRVRTFAAACADVKSICVGGSGYACPSHFYFYF